MFEQRAVLNPGIWKEGEYVHMFYRAIDAQYRSSIGYARLKGPLKVVERLHLPIIRREYDYEKAGVEDPRVMKLGDTYYMLYVAHDGQNAITAYAISKDLKNFKKHGIISPKITYRAAEKLFKKSHLKDAYYLFSAYYQEQAGEDILIWSKDFLLFPKKINGKYAIIHRILPDIQILYFDNFKQLASTAFWKKEIQCLSKNVVLENTHWFESRNIGGGCNPVDTKHGWLLIFHSVEERNEGRVYRASAALLDKKNPGKVIARLHEPLFSPTKKWEKSGLVQNVVFPTGTALFGNELFIYYGAADKYISAVSVNINSLIKTMKNPHCQHPNAKK